MLYVGCRVRILYSYTWPELNGTEGLIVGAGDSKDFDDFVLHPGSESDWIVSPDKWGGPIFEGENGVFLFTPDSEQLEPLLPDGLLEEIENEEVEREKALVEI